MAVAKANKLDLEVVHTEPAKGVSDDYKKLNRLGKVPTFEGADNYVLTECIAIAVYCTYKSISLHPPSLEDEIFLSFSYPCLKTTVENVFTL